MNNESSACCIIPYVICYTSSRCYTTLNLVFSIWSYSLAHKPHDILVVVNMVSILHLPEQSCSCSQFDRERESSNVGEVKSFVFQNEESRK
jgi:hypothetical protein